MPVPHDYYGHHSPEPHLHNRHNSVPYIEPDWQANLAKDQLPDLSTIGRGPRGFGIMLGEVKQDPGKVEFQILSDFDGSVIGTIGPFPTGTMRVYADPVHEPVAGEEVKFLVDYYEYNKDTGDVEPRTTELTVPPGAMGSLIYLYPTELERTKDDTYEINEDDLRIYNRDKYPEKPHVRVNDIIILTTYKNIAEPGEPEVISTWLTLGTVEAVENGKVVFTSRTFYSPNIRWDDIQGKPTNVSYWENDADYQTGDQVQEAIDNAYSDVYRYKGSVDTFAELPDDPQNGDVYNVKEEHEGHPAGTNWAWSESENIWDPFGGEIDLSPYAETTYVDTQDAATLAEAKSYTDDKIDDIETTWDEIVDKPNFANVATSGSYNDLSNKPENVSTFVNDSNYQNANQVNQAIEDALSDLDLDGYLKRVDCTESEYEELTPDHDTVYVVSEDPAPPSPTDGIAYFVFDNETNTGTFFRSFETYEEESTGTFEDIYGNSYQGTVYDGVESPDGWEVPEAKQEAITSIGVADNQVITPKNCSYMFANCTSLSELEISSFDTSSVTEMTGMFVSCQALTSLDLSSFNVSNVTIFRSMFNRCSNLSLIYASDWYDSSRTVTSDDMFEKCRSLPGFDANHVDWQKARIQPDGYFTLKEANNG